MAINIYDTYFRAYVYKNNNSQMSDILEHFWYWPVQSLDWSDECPSKKYYATVYNVRSCLQKSEQCADICLNTFKSLFHVLHSHIHVHTYMWPGLRKQVLSTCKIFSLSNIVTHFMDISSYTQEILRNSINLTEVGYHIQKIR